MVQYSYLAFQFIPLLFKLALFGLVRRLASLSHKSVHVKLLMADKNQLQKGTGLETTHFHFIRLGSVMPFLCSGLPIWLVCREKFTEYAFHTFLEFQINLIFFFFFGREPTLFLH